jgi:hypothetical protein
MENKHSILIVDDDEALRIGLGGSLQVGSVHKQGTTITVALKRPDARPAQ